MPRGGSGLVSRGSAMSVALRNAQRAVPVRRAPLRRAVCALRAALGASRFSVGVVCAGDPLMRRLNGAYRQRPEPTDVLSFPFHRLEPGQLPRPRCPEDWTLGDIFLGVELIHRRCRDSGEDLDAVLAVSPAPQPRSRGRRSACHFLCPRAGDGGARALPSARLPARHAGRVAADGREGGGDPGSAEPRHRLPPAAAERRALLSAPPRDGPVPGPPVAAAAAARPGRARPAAARRPPRRPRRLLAARSRRRPAHQVRAPRSSQRGHRRGVGGILEQLHILPALDTVLQIRSHRKKECCSL
ncbi:uncharacterized protein LOC128852552 isoform X2 [Cuculus canorus]|uniref:uncharacterized protein LOC128852552 isoform X2 n=1 Tax=Cuculus canorus TaxID=55661 RepID=UPI0023AA62BC|nr:uncharacterized protein LOC128852552 isoform X2 [Cuculus canorus]